MLIKAILKLTNPIVLVYSAVGYEYVMDKATTTKCWAFLMVVKERVGGYRNKIRHFVDYISKDKEIV